MGLHVRKYNYRQKYVIKNACSDDFNKQSSLLLQLLNLLHNIVERLVRRQINKYSITTPIITILVVFYNLDHSGRGAVQVAGCPP